MGHNNVSVLTAAGDKCKWFWVSRVTACTANGKFGHPTSRKPLNRFWRNLKLITSPEDHPACKTTYRCVNVCGLGEHPVCHYKFLSSLFFWFLRLAQRSHHWTDLYQNWHVSAVPANDVRFGVLDDDQSNLGVQTPKNQNFGGVNRHFKSNLQKNQIVISSKLCIGLA